MAIRRKRESRDQRRYTRRSTRRGFVLRPPAHPWRIVGGALAAIAVVALALAWGSYLKARSDAFRKAEERGEWTLEADPVGRYNVDVPDVSACSIKPMGNVGDIIIAGKLNGVIMTLRTAGGTLCYRSSIGETAGLPVEADAPTLAEDVSRVTKRGLYVTCVFTVTCFDGEDTATRAYLRGLELALLREYAEAGMTDILLLGLPAGSDTEDAASMEFLQELKALLSDLTAPPAVGVALGTANFTTEEQALPASSAVDTADGSDTSATPPVRIHDGNAPHYTGNMTPARFLSACDYLAVDLRALTAQEVDTVLPHLSYAYTRYSLRLMADIGSPAIAEDMKSHGFQRVLEMEP